MNRWWGSKSESDQQASARSQRAARRSINKLDLHLSDDEEYKECDTSFNNTSIFSVDGANDNFEDSLSDDPSAEPSTMSQAEIAAELARQRALPVEDADFENDPESWKKELKLKFDPSDIKYWFNATEAELKKIGINRQWDKKNAIASMLPPDVTEEVKPILRLTEAEAGDTVY